MKQNEAGMPINLVNGVAGEEIVSQFLVEKGYIVESRNYRQKWGELDIVASYAGVMHFVEVKTVSRESVYRPEENVHPWKMKRLRRVIQTFLLERGKNIDFIDWQFDVAIVVLDRKKGEQVSFIEDLIL